MNRNNYKKKLQSGFTIVELMVIVVIMGIVMVVGGRGYVNQVRETELKRDAQQIVDDMERARQKAISRDTEGVVECSVLSYAIGFSVNYGFYGITRKCEDNNYDNLVWSTMKSSIIQSATPYTIDFNYPYGTPNSTQQVVVTHKTLGRCITIEVNSVGVVSISDPVQCT